MPLYVTVKLSSYFKEQGIYTITRCKWVPIHDVCTRIRTYSSCRAAGKTNQKQRSIQMAESPISDLTSLIFFHVLVKQSQLMQISQRHPIQISSLVSFFIGLTDCSECKYTHDVYTYVLWILVLPSGPWHSQHTGLQLQIHKQSGVAFL